MNGTKIQTKLSEMRNTIFEMRKKKSTISGINGRSCTWHVSNAETTHTRKMVIFDNIDMEIM